MKHTARPLLLAALLTLVLAGCRSQTPEDEALEASGLLTAERVESGAGPIAVRVLGSGEPLGGRDGLPPTDPAGRWMIEFEVANRSGGSISGLAAGLVDDSGDGGAAPEIAEIGQLAGGEDRSVRWRWTLSRTDRPVQLAVVYREGGVARRVLVPVGKPADGILLESIEVAGEEDLSRRSKRLLGREAADALDYDLLVATGEQALVVATFSGQQARIAMSARIEIGLFGRGGPKIEIDENEIVPGRGREVRLLVDAEGVFAGRYPFEIVSRRLVEGSEVVRRWSLTIGVADYEIVEDGARFRFDVRLPSGATASWDGPATLTDRPMPTGVGEAIEHLRSRSSEDLAAAFRASRLSYQPPGGAIAADALRAELVAGLGRTSGYALLRAQIQRDLARALPAEPALDRALGDQAGDLGIEVGADLMAGALADWKPAAGDVPLAEAPEPEARPIEEEAFEPLVALPSIRPTHAVVGGGGPRPIVPGAELAVDALPLSVAYDVATFADADEASFEMVLLGQDDLTVSVEATADGGAVECFVERLDPGTYRCGLVARWPSGRTVSAPAVAISVTAPKPSSDDFPSDLLGLMSPTERERVRRGDSFQKTVAVQRGGRLRLSRRQFVIEMGKVVDKGDVSVELLSARFDEASGQTTVEFRVVSKRTKKWDLSVQPEGQAGAAAPPPTQRSLSLVEGEPETVSFSIPGRLGESFTLLEHRISGSPTSSQGGFGVSSSFISGLAARTASISALLSAAMRLGTAEYQVMSLADFQAAGGQVDIKGTGGPNVSITIVTLPPGLAANAVLRIPAGTKIGGGTDVQALVLPGEVLIELATVGSGPIYSTAYCVEKEKPFPGGDGGALSIDSLSGPAGLFSRHVGELLRSGGYAGFDGISSGALTEVGQLIVWAYLELPAGQALDLETQRRLEKGFRYAVDKLPEFKTWNSSRKAKFAESATFLFLDAWTLTQLSSS